MADPQWLKNLALSTYEENGWKTNQESIDQTIEQRRSGILAQTYDECLEVSRVYNSIATPERKIQLFTQQYPRPNVQLLMGHVAAKISLVEDSLQIIYSSVTQYRTMTHKKESLNPFADKFGTLLWHTDDNLLLNVEMVIKAIVEELNRIYFDIERGPS